MSERCLFHALFRATKKKGSENAIRVIKMEEFLKINVGERTDRLTHDEKISIFDTYEEQFD